MFPLKDDIPSRTVPYVTRAIVLFNVLVFLFELMLGSELKTLYNRFTILPVLYTNPIYWKHFGLNLLVRPFSAMFMHGGWMHLIGNMWILWIFGDNVEDRLGHVRFLFFYLMCGLFSMGVHILFSWNSQIPTLGASGAIAGVLGAYLVLYPRARVLTLLPIFFLIPISNAATL